MIYAKKELADECVMVKNGVVYVTGHGASFAIPVALMKRKLKEAGE